MFIPAAVILLAGLAFEPPDALTRVYSFHIGTHTVQVPLGSKSWVRYDAELYAVDDLIAKTFSIIRPSLIEESNRLSGVAMLLNRTIEERLRQAHEADNDDAVTAYSQVKQSISMSLMMNVAVRELGKIPIRPKNADTQRNAHNFLITFIGQISFLDMAITDMRGIENRIRLDAPSRAPPTQPPDQRREKKRRASLG